MAGALTLFGNRCRELRNHKAYTMGDQARALSCNVHHISAIETGKTAPTSEYLEGLRQWLALDDKEFLYLIKRTKSNLVGMRSPASTSNNSNSMRMFRKLSKLDPVQIRMLRSKIEGEVEDD